MTVEKKDFYKMVQEAGPLDSSIMATNKPYVPPVRKIAKLIWEGIGCECPLDGEEVKDVIDTIETHIKKYVNDVLYAERHKVLNSLSEGMKTKALEEWLQQLAQIIVDREDK